jgi:hypothetical protein
LVRAGVYVGDLGLWLAGRLLGRRVLAFSWVARRVNGIELERLAGQIDRHLGITVIGSRVLPGTRLPMYLATGVWGRRPGAFAGWSLLGVLLWTPALLLATLRFGDAVTGVLLGHVESIWHYAVAGFALLVGLRAASNMVARAFGTSPALNPVPKTVPRPISSICLRNLFERKAAALHDWRQARVLATDRAADDFSAIQWRHSRYSRTSRDRFATPGRWQKGRVRTTQALATGEPE